MRLVEALSKSRASPLIFDMLEGVLREGGRIHFEHQQIALAAMNANHGDVGPFRDVAENERQARQAIKILSAAPRTFHR
jgi:hypothetical protein